MYGVSAMFMYGVSAMFMYGVSAMFMYGVSAMFWSGLMVVFFYHGRSCVESSGPESHVGRWPYMELSDGIWSPSRIAPLPTHHYQVGGPPK